MAKIAWLDQRDLDDIRSGDDQFWLNTESAHWVLDSANYQCGYFLVGLWHWLARFFSD